jgi:3-oxoacyl-[acyl-carrier-protein] synthase-3
MMWHVDAIRIASVGTALPGPPIDNAELTKLLRMSPIVEQWVDTFIGTKTRYLAVDLATGEIRCNLTDLAERAGRQALDAAGLDAGRIDLMVMGTSMPDALIPTTVNMVADRLGINDIPTYQMQSGCAGAVQAFDVAWQMLRTGRHRTALVLGGDVCAKHVDLSIDYSRLPPGEMINTLLFGDGAGAAVLTTDPSLGTTVVHDTVVRLTGTGMAPALILDWFGVGDRHQDRVMVSEDFKVIRQLVPRLAGEVLDHLLAARGWTRQELAYLLPPQLSPRMTGQIMQSLGVREEAAIGCVAETGNNGNALLFFQLGRLLPVLQPGDRAVAISIESSKWIKGGITVESLKKSA